MLAEEGSKWIYDKDGKFTSPEGYIAYMKFEKDSCTSYYLDSGKAIRDSIYRGTWNYSEKDSLLDIMGNKRKVTGIAPDTIYLLRPGNNFKAILVRYRE